MSDQNHSRRLAARLFAAALLLAGAGSALAGVHYVDVNSTNATPPYTNWITAATNIQDAVDAAVAGDEIVVTNGTYATGARDNEAGTSRVVVDKPLTVRSVDGPQLTTIVGGGPCVYLTSGATLSGFTLTGGTTYGFGGLGGGVFGGSLIAVVSNCVLAGNVAVYGGGAYRCTLNNCTLTGNQAVSGVQAKGGGALFCTLNNCALTGNSAIDTVGTAYVYGGGAADCTLNNCTLAYNSASGTHSYGGGAYHGGFLRNCIVYFNTARLGPNLYENFPIACWTQSDPRFVNRNNFHLRPNSPCINAGDNSSVTGATDLDGNPRISDGAVDIGAYEYQWPELTIAPSGPNVLLSWPTNNAGYDYTGFMVQCTTNLVSPAVWSTNSPAPVVIGGQNVVTNPVTGPRQFYRLSQ